MPSQQERFLLRFDLFSIVRWEATDKGVREMDSLQGCHILVLDKRTDSDVRLRGSLGKEGCATHRKTTLQTLKEIFCQFKRLKAILINADDIGDDRHCMTPEEKEILEDLLVDAAEFGSLPIGIFSASGNIQRLQKWRGRYMPVSVLSGQGDYHSILLELLHEEVPA